MSTSQSTNQPEFEIKRNFGMKQVVPLVYIQSPATTTITITAAPKLQTTTASVPSTTQNVILTPCTFNKSLVIQKHNAPSTGATKIGQYLTMLTPLKPAEHKLPGSASHKYVLAPMPKSNRLPATSTVTSFMPITIPKVESRKIFNVNKSIIDLPSETTITPEIRRQDNNENVHSAVHSLKPFNKFKITTVPSKRKISILHREPARFTKHRPKRHGISILKKNFRPRSAVEEAVVVDSSTSEVVEDKLKSDVEVPECIEMAQLTPPQENEDVPEPSEPAPVPAEPSAMVINPVATEKKFERRRKSNFTCRKDFDCPMEAVDDEKSNKLEIVEEKPENIEPEVTQTALEMQKFLKWEEDIGSLPGSEAKFIVNEFNLVEYVTDDEYKKLMEKRTAEKRPSGEAKPKLAPKKIEADMQCLECGCYGLPSEFINPKYCSFDCQNARLSKTAAKETSKEPPNKFKRKKKKGCQKKTDAPEGKSDEKEPSASEEEVNTSNDNSQDKFSYPWTCKKKGFSWAKYLDHMKAKSAPVKLFKDPFPYSRNGFRNGMKLEGIDPQHPGYFCVLTVSEVLGYRIRLHFDGYPDNYDFWVNADSLDIFPMGWCEKYGHVLQPPPGYTIDSFNWVAYLKQTKSTAAPKNLFVNRSGNAICPNGFRIGMKLEAVDRKNTALVCVATVRDMMDNRILVHFDSWDDVYDYWADPASPLIHPIGWCDRTGHNLTTPSDYANPDSFTWQNYLVETNSVAAPVRAFKQKSVSGFKKGMRLESVDRRVPRLIRVATIDEVKNHQIRIRFDGWPDRYNYWVYDDNLDIHPVGWCHKTGHPIEPPLTPGDLFDFPECPTVGCKGVGHIKGPKYANHSLPKHCPYAEENIDADKVLPDRLLSPDRALDAVVPISIEPKETLKPSNKPRMGRPPKPQAIKQERIDDDDEDDLEVAIDEPKPVFKKMKLEKKEHVPIAARKKAMKLIENDKWTPVELESWKKHSLFLQEFVACRSDPRLWTAERVQSFVSGLPNCEDYCDVFKVERIDGEALLLLNMKDITNILKFKVGPAVKLYNSIILLRQQVNIFT